MSFSEKWLAAVDAKGSILCAGLDPAEHGTGKEGYQLEPDQDKLTWALNYTEDVAPYCAALKANHQFWGGKNDFSILQKVTKLAHDQGMVVIDDRKSADIGSSNTSGFYNSRARGFDAVTIAPYAGNMLEAIREAHDTGLGVIPMCLMSNPDFEREKRMLVPVLTEGYFPRNITPLNGITYVPRYIQLAHDASRFGADGVVIGAPSIKNYITDTELEELTWYLRSDRNGYLKDDLLILVPGVGVQEGDLSVVWNYFNPGMTIVNVGRSLMFPKGQTHTETAQQYQGWLNQLRTE